MYLTRQRKDKCRQRRHEDEWNKSLICSTHPGVYKNGRLDRFGYSVLRFGPHSGGIGSTWSCGPFDGYRQMARYNIRHIGDNIADTVVISDTIY